MNEHLPEGAMQQVDLTNCDREPIHLLGTIQPFGLLIAVSDRWVITRATASVEKWLGVTAASLLGRPIDQVFDAGAVHAIRGQLQAAMSTNAVARMFGVDLRDDNALFDIAVHIVGDTIVIECEPSIPEPTVNSAALVRAMVARLQGTEDLRTFYRFGAREMRALTGFDRVMVYRFDHDESGEVVAESARVGLESFLGLHYPASDIPKQARILYEKNWLRIIPDIDAVPSPIVAMHADATLDLSLSVLRSVSPIHIEYLRNMGVSASMSVSILKDGKLWGLFACHHYSPWHVSFERRTAAELFGQMFSLLLESRERDSEVAYESRARKLHNRLIASMAGETPNFDTVISRLDEIADLLTCDGVAASIDGRVTLHGQTPTVDQMSGLIDFLRRQDVRDSFASNDLGGIYPPAKDFANRAAGLLAVSLSRPARDYIIFFRKEVARTVTWAGNPIKPALIGPLGDRLTPRKSFDLWLDTVRGQSFPWSAIDIRIAESLRISLLEVILRLADLAMKERRTAQARQELLIAELNHRVRNILGLIRGLISQSRDSSLSIDEFTNVIGGRIQALARAHDQITAENWSPSSFHKLVQLEAEAYLRGQVDRVKFIGPDVLLEPAAFTTMALVVHELMTNSAKYGALTDHRGGVDLKTSFDPEGRLRINWHEIGGPPVVAPTRRGFGSTIIERSIPFDLKGQADIDYAASGVKADFLIPQAHFRVMTAAEASTPVPTRVKVAAPALNGVALVVEDNLIIALDAEASLLELGADRVQVASNVEQALELIAKWRPDVALLDVNLGAETSFVVGEKLIALGVPFVFATGYGEKMNYPEMFATVPKIVKPYSSQTLRDALALIIRV